MEPSDAPDLLRFSCLLSDDDVKGICATVAFGMGLDLYRCLPGDSIGAPNGVESYIQERRSW